MSYYTELWGEDNNQDVHGLISDCCNSYDPNRFLSVFDKVMDLRLAMSSPNRTISDKELEWAITELPLDLFAVSEVVNEMRLGCQVLKIDMKELKLNIGSIDSSTPEYYVVQQSIDNKNKLIAIHECSIKRIESQVSLSKEFIMGAKKVWDSRRHTEESNPIGEPTIPDYFENKTYIK